ncbi:hypothetical protein BJY01DRAFT_228652 [Aspergillus pseudoustus]|uniref:G-patch domain-containing protein n=1 Tax=Aspergillus pseudoustus TaxID=1810923 RepID=A0ABR4IK34_9EURO
MTTAATTMSTDASKPQNKIDAYAYLIRHGWSGTGNPLNPDRAGGKRGGLGLTKPLLVARRSGNQGIGKKTTKDPTNQWWLRGFEDALKGVGTDAPANGSTAGKANALTSELYRFFVRGEVVPGTLGNNTGKDMDVGAGDNGGKKRKRENDDEGARESKEERRKGKEEKRARKAEKEAKREARREKKEKKRAKKALKALEKKCPEDDYPTPVSMDLDSADNAQGVDVPLDLAKLEKLKKDKKEKKKEKERKKEKSKKRDTSSSSDESLKQKSKKSKTS